MGKTIVSWSPVHGQAATTSNLAALASHFSLNYRAKNLITHTQLTYSSLEALFGKELEEVGFEDGGIKALERLAVSNLLKADAVMDYAETIYGGKLDILGGSEKVESEQSIIELLITFLRDAYDLVWIDAHSGTRNELTLRLLKSADIILVNLPQNRFILDRFYNSPEYQEVLEGKEVITLISCYDEKSSFNIRRIKRRYKVKKSIYPINYSNQFKDAANKFMLAEFFYRHVFISNEHPVYDFIQSLERVNSDIAKRMEITKDVREEDVG